MAFKVTKRTSGSLDNPETMFRDIKTKKIPGPLADQADLWRLYSDKAVDEPNVALQLPTGGGKTLVGIVIAEWRRRKFGERVLLLCPTRQLVTQVVQQATDTYGIPVVGFTGSKKAYATEAMFQYQNAERVAVTTYSSVFNVAPYFSDPQMLILDDAHSAEQYIASMWSLSIQRMIPEHKPIYEAITSILRPLVSPEAYLRLTRPETTIQDRGWVEKIPTPSLQSIHAELLACIDAHADGVPDHMFSWRTIRDHLLACHVYLGAGEILIRPLIPPAQTHPPFADATQRVYMSATLGEGGELERITGMPRILRLRSTSGPERQTVGRRYFIFPERSLSDSEQQKLCEELMRNAGRTLVLTPDDRRAKAFGTFVAEKLQFPVVSAQDLEATKSRFTSEPRAVAIIANRYDGIDLPGAECRLLLIEGLPRATNLQEQFLISRMGAVDLLHVRISTRLVQAFGRCTRSDEDYAAVLIRGEELNKHLLTGERRRSFEPELQAELSFGLEQAEGETRKGFAENFALFLAQGPEWSAANADIVSRRDALRQDAIPGAGELAASAPTEIEYQLAVWHGNYAAAYEHATQVLGKLRHTSLRGYRALWHYLAGSAAWLAGVSGDAPLRGRAVEQYRAALKVERAIYWLVALRQLAGEESQDRRDCEDGAALRCVERLETLFADLGTLHDHKYNGFERDIRSKLESNLAAVFEAGHEGLGKLLGYESGNRNDTGAPDPWWIADESLCLIFEDHSDAEPGSSLHVNKARQVCTHPNWAREHLPLRAGADILAVLITPVSKADKEATPHLESVCVWPIGDFRTWAYEAIGIVRELRRDYPGAGDLDWRARALERMEAANITPRRLAEELRKYSANAMFGRVRKATGPSRA